MPESYPLLILSLRVASKVSCSSMSLIMRLTSVLWIPCGSLVLSNGHSSKSAMDPPGLRALTALRMTALRLSASNL